MDALLTFRTYVRILYVSNRKVVLDMGELKEKIIELIEKCMDEVIKIDINQKESNKY